MFTGRCHFCTIRLAEDAACRFLSRKEETTENIPCNFERQIGAEKPTTNRYTKESVFKLWGLMKRTRLDDAL